MRKVKKKLESNRKEKESKERIGETKNSYHTLKLTKPKSGRGEDDDEGKKKKSVKEKED